VTGRAQYQKAQATCNFRARGYSLFSGGVASSLLFVTANGQALITVRDTGIGIEPGAAARIFEPFVRLDAARGRDRAARGSDWPSSGPSSPPMAAPWRSKARRERAAASRFACP
jgi:hypothetical protein